MFVHAIICMIILCIRHPYFKKYALLTHYKYGGEYVLIDVTVRLTTACNTFDTLHLAFLSFNNGFLKTIAQQFRLASCPEIIKINDNTCIRLYNT